MCGYYAATATATAAALGGQSRLALLLHAGVLPVVAAMQPHMTVQGRDVLKPS